jgi:hypothetical protein
LKNGRLRAEEAGAMAGHGVPRRVSRPPLEPSMAGSKANARFLDAPYQASTRAGFSWKGER